jgi:hypothetical protein
MMSVDGSSSFLICIKEEIVEMSKKKATILFPTEVCIFYEERAKKIIFGKKTL